MLSTRGMTGMRPAQRRRTSGVRVFCGGAPDFQGKHVVVIGGTGRVGSSTASALIKSFPGLKVTVASRSKDSYQQMLGRRPELSKAEFRPVDIDSQDSIKVSNIASAVVLGGPPLAA